MGLLQRAIETYDASAALAGVYREGHEPLAPIGHVLTSANIEITLNAQGGFETARRVEKNEPKILIPVTEESGGRTSGIAAHPLCEQLKYVACTNMQAHESYLAALRAWMESPHGHPFLPAIFTYVLCDEGDAFKRSHKRRCTRSDGEGRVQREAAGVLACIGHRRGGACVLEKQEPVCSI